MRTRPYRRRHRVTRPACRALAHEALSSSPSCDPTRMSCACARGLIVIAIVRRDRHVVRLRTRPYRCCHHATQPACRALAHEALSLLPSCDATGMSCACARGLIVVARLAMRPACRALAQEALLLSPSCDATGMSCACAQGLIVVARLAMQRACRALAHEALSSSPVWRRNRHVVRLRTRPYRRRPSGNVSLLHAVVLISSKKWGANM